MRIAICLLALSPLFVNAQSYKHGTLVVGYIGESEITVAADTRETNIYFVNENGKKVRRQRFTTINYKKIGLVGAKGYGVAGFHPHNIDSLMGVELTKRKSFREHIKYFKDSIKATLEPSVKYQFKSDPGFWMKERLNISVLDLMFFGFENNKPIAFIIKFMPLQNKKGEIYLKVVDSTYQQPMSIIQIGEQMPDSAVRVALFNWRNETPNIFLKKCIIETSKVINTIAPPIDVLEIKSTGRSKWYRYLN